MKKYIFLFSALVFLSACGNNAQVEQAKQEILSPETSVDIPKDTSQTGTLAEESQETNTKETISILPVSSTQYLTFDTIDETALANGELVISGSAEEGVEKIEVIFENATSDFPRDEYILQTFKKGDASFKYVASSRFQVLDFGENIYTVKAYKGKEISETQITVFVSESSESSFPVEISDDISYESKIIGDEASSITLDLPLSSTFGNPVSTGQNSFTYSNINGFEITKQDVSDISCDTVTATL